MKKNLAIIALCLFTNSLAHAGDAKWNGGAEMRYGNTTYNDSLDSPHGLSDQYSKKIELRANLGVVGGWDNLEYGLGFRTQSAINNSFATVSELNNKDPGIRWDIAWMRFVRDFSFFNLGITIGHQKNIFAEDPNSQFLFSEDDRFDGLGWSFNLVSLGMNMGQYVLGHDSSSAHLGMLYGFQPYLNWKFSDETDILLAAGFYSWNHAGIAGSADSSNLSGGDYNTSSYNNNASAPFAYNMNSAHQWQFLALLNLPYNLGLNGEYVKNQKANYPGSGTIAPVPVDNIAWTAGLVYGKLKKSHDFTFGYYYGKKGLGSVLDSYSNVLFPADNEGHTVFFKVNALDHFHVGAEALILTEVGLKQGNGLAYANPNQIQTSTYWEVNTGMEF